MSAGPNYKRTPDHERLVHDMCIAGIARGDIARVLKIDEDTLAKFYKHELDTVEKNAVAAVAQKLYSKAIGGDLGAMIFYLKCRGRWREIDKQQDRILPMVLVRHDNLGVQQDQPIEPFALIEQDVEAGLPEHLRGVVPDSDDPSGPKRG